MTGSEFNLRIFIWQILIGVISTILTSLIISLYTANWWIMIIVAVIVIFTVWIFVWQRRKLKLLLSGWSTGCYYTFPVGDNLYFWKKHTRKSFQYLGISANTFIETFRGWVLHLPGDSPFEFRFLLMSPQAKALTAQIAHKLNIAATDPSVASEADIVRRNIETSILMLKGLDIYRRGKLVIRLYDEFIPWWFYIIDDQIALIGILEKGKSGRDSPAMIFKKHNQYGSPFEAFEYTWARLWAEADDA